VTKLAATLRGAGDRRISGAGRHHLRRALVVVEVALAVILVIGAGLLVHTVYNLTKVDAGFEPSRLVTFQATVPQLPPVRQQMYLRLLNGLRGIPGVQAATAVWGLPPNRAANFNNTGFDIPAALPGEPAQPRYQVVDYDQFVMSDYFETMGIAIVAGRSFQPTDAGPDTTVVVVNEALAKKVWPGLNPIGRRLRRCCGDQMPWLTVIGTAKDVKQGGVDQPVGTEFYVFAEQQATPPQTMNFVLRTTLPPEVLSPTIERVVRNVDATIPIVRLRDMDAVFADSIRRPRLLAQLLGGFAGLALLLAAIGTYGIVSYMVTERQREIGIRMALGAGRARVIARVMRQGLTLTTIGIGLGVIGALWLNSLIASLLFGVEPTDEATMTAVIATIVIVATIACALPAVRASRLDPNVVLRTN
jgi:putative ABC transport system permease protein